LLRFFVEDQRYSIVDRFSQALSKDVAESSIYEALRIIESLKNNAVKVKMEVTWRSGNEVKSKVYDLTCCDYGEVIEERVYPGIRGKIISVEPNRKEMIGRNYYCVQCPQTPSEEELKQFLEKMEKDLTICRELGILAYGEE